MMWQVMYTPCIVSYVVLDYSMAMTNRNPTSWNNSIPSILGESISTRERQTNAWSVGMRGLSVMSYVRHDWHTSLLRYM